MPIATKNNAIIVKDGKVAENCDCCGGWYCYRCQDGYALPAAGYGNVSSSDYSLSLNSQPVVLGNAELVPLSATLYPPPGQTWRMLACTPRPEFQGYDIRLAQKTVYDMPYRISMYRYSDLPGGQEAAFVEFTPDELPPNGFEVSNSSVRFSLSTSADRPAAFQQIEVRLRAAQECVGEARRVATSLTATVIRLMSIGVYGVSYEPLSLWRQEQLFQIQNDSLAAGQQVVFSSDSALWSPLDRGVALLRGTTAKVEDFPPMDMSLSFTPAPLFSADC